MGRVWYTPLQYIWIFPTFIRHLSLQLSWWCLHWIICNLHPWYYISTGKNPPCYFWTTTLLLSDLTQKLFEGSLRVYPHKWFALNSNLELNWCISALTLFHIYIATHSRKNLITLWNYVFLNHVGHPNGHSLPLLTPKKMGRFKNNYFIIT